MQPKPPRPTGVTILGVLAILAALGFLFLGAVFIAGATAATILFATYPVFQSVPIALLATLAYVLGALFLIFGIVELAIAIGFFGGKGWAWTLGIVANIILLIINVLTLPGSILGLVINIIILYYLTRPRIKAFFGKGPPMGPTMGSGMMTASTMGSSMGSGPTGSTMVRCSNCGTNVAPGTTKCPACGAAL